MPCSKKGISVLATILIMVHWTNPYSDMNSLMKIVHIMKFRRNCVINDQVRVYICANGQAVVICAAILVIIHQTIPTVDLGKEFGESNLYM